MSGGVDSSVVAAMLAADGYDVVGVTLQLYDHGAALARKGACCAGRDIHDARRVAERVGFPHYVLDYESRFREAVVEEFADAYLAGATPVPCIRCNERVKFRDLLETAKDLDADCMATGHYVRRVDGPAGPELHRAADPARDQSYFLFATTREQLGFLRFPLGGLASKAETRALRGALRPRRRRQARQPGHLLRAGRLLRRGHREAAPRRGRARRHRAPRRPRARPPRGRDPLHRRPAARPRHRRRRAALRRAARRRDAPRGRRPARGARDARRCRSPRSTGSATRPSRRRRPRAGRSRSGCARPGRRSRRGSVRAGRTGPRSSCSRPRKGWRRARPASSTPPKAAGCSAAAGSCGLS